MSSVEAREELEALSYDDQKRIEREKFGMVGYPVEETPELIALAMEELGEALSTMSEEKEAYETMLFIDPEYVQSEEFQLPFLRADLFNASAAARRIVDYWEHKVQLFDIEKLLKRYISLLDLKEEDYRALKRSIAFGSSFLKTRHHAWTEKSELGGDFDHDAQIFLKDRLQKDLALA